MAFSKSGFTEDAIEYAKNKDIRLVSLEMMKMCYNRCIIGGCLL